MSAFELLGMHEPGDVVAFGGEGSRTAADLLADAARISRALPPAFEGSHVLLVFEEDRYWMAAALLGALDRGHAVSLPPNSRRESILAVHERPETAIVVHDTDAGFPICIADILAADDGRGAGLTAPVVPHPGVIATVFTSGTTGPMTAWQKTSAELLGEAAMLGAAFEVEKGARIVGGVSSGHIYGLLFTVLMPLMRGAAFSRETPHHAEAVARCVEANRADILVTVPAQLRALEALGAGALSRLRRVFSSTGPLPESVADAFNERHGLPVTEILGSTETGGIASRTRQLRAREGWRPFDEVGVSVSGEGRLRVDSPFVYTGLPRPFETADLVEMNEDGSFTHLGRMDGIVKIGGRRVSIQEVEDALRQQPGVVDASVVAVPVAGARGNQLLAAVVPASLDVEPLKSALLERFEPSCLPRRILCLESLPRDANGKAPRDRLLRLFDLQGDGRSMNWKLEWGEPNRSRSGAAERFEISVRVPDDYAWFEGHFEEYPVLAGAAQLKELILPTVTSAFPELGPVQTMSRIKFTGRITPGNSLSVRVEKGAKPGRVSFEIRKGDEVCSRGMLSLVVERGA
jgi:acyl-coenzyme A synthetase/AMP-(fatty) acid ligase